MLLEAAFKDFTSKLIEKNELLQGQLTTCTINNEEVKLQDKHANFVIYNSKKTRLPKSP